MEDTIDDAATALADQLTDLLDLIDRAEKSKKWEPTEWACVGWGLDFVTYDEGGRRVAISAKTGTTLVGRARFKAQLQRCAVCLNSEECYQKALDTGADIGIWGGTFPHERKTP